MPLFDYKVISNDGIPYQDTSESGSKMELMSALEGDGNTIIFIKEKKNFSIKGFDFSPKIKPEDIAVFTDQLSTMLNAGVPLLASLEAIYEQMEHIGFKKVIAQIIKDVNGGLSLSQALLKHPKYFEKLYTSMIESGEKAGTVDSVLKRLETFIDKDITTKRSVKAAMRYPIMVFTAMIIAFIVVIVFVIPTFADLFEQQNVELPMPTKILIGISNFFSNYWYLAIIISVSIFYGFKYYINTEKGRIHWDGFKMRAPVFGALTQKSSLARFAHTLRTLSQSGIQIIDALNSVANTVGNEALRIDILKAREDVMAGNTIASSLKKSKYFPPLTVRMIDIGEQAGAIDEMLENVAKTYDRDVDYEVTKLAGMIEPIMTVVMGIFVVVLALGVFLPMWNMYSAVQ
ncbi:MAG: type II secretion system F family protein [Candidatus Marinimicrobia bacterium]|nr:type II secretion system F family protein [Candidatus Neomarinimicrobiota bacterium]